MKMNRKKDISPKYLFLTFSIICILLLLLSFFAGNKITAIRNCTITVISPIQEGINSIGIWFDSKLENLNTIQELLDENEKLKQEVAKYKEQLTTYQNQLSELESLKELYALDELYPEYNKTASHVFAKDSSSWFSIFYIDKGTADGLYEGANVMCDDGLAGIIIECNTDYSMVRAIIHDSSNISAKVLPSNALCTVEGSVTAYENGTLAVKNIDKDANVEIGDKVVTSQISDRFHPGITIGYITDITYDTNNITMTAYIKPAVNFDDISDVLIITDKLKTVN